MKVPNNKYCPLQDSPSYKPVDIPKKIEARIRADLAAQLHEIVAKWEGRLLRDYVEIP
jgi:hypothetical protein